MQLKNMPVKTNIRLRPYSPKRATFPDDEASHPWLPILLDAYHIIDKGIAKAIEIQGSDVKKPACSKGCSNCCEVLKSIPVYPLELVGISWYATEKLSGQLREVLKKQLRGYKDESRCPFLVDKMCVVYNLRPISCRQFIVFGRSCDKGEDPYYTRKNDVLIPMKEYLDDAIYIMLPFYGVTDESDRREIIKSSAINKFVSVIQSCKWESLADKMDEFDKMKKIVAAGETDGE